MDTTASSTASGGLLTIRRSRGALSGFLLVLLGLWGAFAPFVGPTFAFAFDPATAWTWTAARGWLEVLPGAVTVAGGMVTLLSRNRATAILGGWLSVGAGAWFVVGRALAEPLGIGDIGAPVADTPSRAAWIELAFFDGLGALVIALGAVAIGRLSVRSVRDVEYVQRDRAAAAAAESPVTDTARADSAYPAPVAPSATPADPATTTAPAGPAGSGRNGHTVYDPAPVTPRRRGLRGRLGGRRTRDDLVSG